MRLCSINKDKNFKFPLIALIGYSVRLYSTSRFSHFFILLLLVNTYLISTLTFPVMSYMLSDALFYFFTNVFSDGNGGAGIDYGSSNNSNGGAGLDDGNGGAGPKDRRHKFNFYVSDFDGHMDFTPTECTYNDNEMILLIMASFVPFYIFYFCALSTRLTWYTVATLYLHPLSLCYYFLVAWVVFFFTSMIVKNLIVSVIVFFIIALVSFIALRVLDYWYSLPVILSYLVYSLVSVLFLICLVSILGIHGVGKFFLMMMVFFVSFVVLILFCFFIMFNFLTGSEITWEFFFAMFVLHFCCIVFSYTVCYPIICNIESFLNMFITFLKQSYHIPITDSIDNISTEDYCTIHILEYDGVIAFTGTEYFPRSGYSGLLTIHVMCSIGMISMLLWIEWLLTKWNE